MKIEDNPNKFAYKNKKPKNQKTKKTKNKKTNHFFLF